MIASNDFTNWSDAILVLFVISCCLFATVQFVRVWRRKHQQQDFPVAPEKKDLRRSVRSVNEPPVKVFLQTPTGELIDCFVVDWSNGGLGLFIRGDYGKLCAKSSEIALKPRNNVEAPWTMVQPRHSRPEPHGVFVGVKFADEIDRSTLRRFRTRTKVTT
jgi:hypothetical protein